MPQEKNYVGPHHRSGHHIKACLENELACKAPLYPTCLNKGRFKACWLCGLNSPRVNASRCPEGGLIRGFQLLNWVKKFHAWAAAQPPSVQPTPSERCPQVRKQFMASFLAAIFYQWVGQLISLFSSFLLLHRMYKLRAYMHVLWRSSGS